MPPLVLGRRGTDEADDDEVETLVAPGTKMKPKAEKVIPVYEEEPVDMMADIDPKVLRRVPIVLGVCVLFSSAVMLWSMGFFSMVTPQKAKPHAASVVHTTKPPTDASPKPAAPLSSASVERSHAPIEPAKKPSAFMPATVAPKVESQAPVVSEEKDRDATADNDEANDEKSGGDDEKSSAEDTKDSAGDEKSSAEGKDNAAKESDAASGDDAARSEKKSGANDDSSDESKDNEGDKGDNNAEEADGDDKTASDKDTKTSTDEAGENP